MFQHDLLSSSVQCFSEGIGAGNGHSGVPSVIGAKLSIDASEDEAESMNTCSSSKASGKKAKASEFLGLSEE